MTRVELSIMPAFIGSRLSPYPLKAKITLGIKNTMTLFRGPEIIGYFLKGVEGIGTLLLDAGDKVRGVKMSSGAFKLTVKGELVRMPLTEEKKLFLGSNVRVIYSNVVGRPKNERKPGGAVVAFINASLNLQKEPDPVSLYLEAVPSRRLPN